MNKSKYKPCTHSHHTTKNCFQHCFKIIIFQYYKRITWFTMVYLPNSRCNLTNPMIGIPHNILICSICSRHFVFCFYTYLYFVTRIIIYTPTQQKLSWFFSSNFPNFHIFISYCSSLSFVYFEARIQ